MVLLFAVLLLWTGEGLAQQTPARKAPARKSDSSAQKRWPIEALNVEGNRVFTKDQVLAITGLKIGELAGKDEFDAAQGRLTASGAFDTVGYRFGPGPNGKGYAAVFQVTEVEPLLPVRFERLGVPDQDIIKYVKTQDPLFGAKIPATKSVLDRYTRLIQQYLDSHQHPEKITAKVTPGGPDEYAIIFRPAREAPSVAQVSFSGNSVVPSNLLRDAIAGVAVGLPYDEQRFRELLDTSVRPVYDARGRVRVTFPKVTVEPAKDVQGLAVQVTVDEGASYDLGDVRVAGNTVMKSQDLLKTGGFKTGDLANFEQVGQGVERIKKALQRSGYLNADAKLERKIDDRKKTVDVSIQVEEGPQYTLGRLDIQGLDLDGTAAIRKMWTLKEGKPYNTDYPQHFLDRVREDGVFDNLGKTRFEAKINEKDHTVDVTLSFAGEGSKPGPGRHRPPQ